MYLGDDPIRRMLVKHVYAEDGFCQTGDHCLALDCPLNRADKEHLLHMLDMTEDEELDSEAAKEWGTSSTLEGFILFARKISLSLPEDIKRPQAPVSDQNPE
jgi:hypothetical protein